MLPIRGQAFPILKSASRQWTAHPRSKLKTLVCAPCCILSRSLQVMRCVAFWLKLGKTCCRASLGQGMCEDGLARHRSLYVRWQKNIPLFSAVG